VVIALRFRSVAISVGLVVCAVAAVSADLGVRGPTYPIAEPDLLAAIMSALQAKADSGEMARRIEESKKRAAAHIITPAPVDGLTRTVMPRSVVYDPTITVREPIVDGSGRIIVPAGTTANPLDVVSMTEQLYFIDGRDPAQVRQAKRVADQLGYGVQVVLTGGSPVLLAQAWHRPVYFDQGGKLVHKFGIRQVPARVMQQGNQLQVDELAVSAH
jgi:conjugal transfer pilus assembly protein TraW